MLNLKDELEIDDNFPGDQELAMSQDIIPWFTNLANYMIIDVVPSYQQHKKFMSDMRRFL